MGPGRPSGPHAGSGLFCGVRPDVMLGYTPITRPRGPAYGPSTRRNVLGLGRPSGAGNRTLTGAPPRPAWGLWSGVLVNPVGGWPGAPCHTAAHHDRVLILVCRRKPGAIRAGHLSRHRADLRTCSVVLPSGHRAVHSGRLLLSVAPTSGPPSPLVPLSRSGEMSLVLGLGARMSGLGELGFTAG